MILIIISVILDFNFSCRGKKNWADNSFSRNFNTAYIRYLHSGELVYCCINHTDGLFNFRCNCKMFVIFYLQGTRFGYPSIAVIHFIRRGNLSRLHQISQLASAADCYILSGFIFRLKACSLPIQILSYITPAKYYIIILWDILLKGSGFSVFSEQMLYLLILLQYSRSICCKDKEVKEQLEHSENIYCKKEFLQFMRDPKCLWSCWLSDFIQPIFLGCVANRDIKNVGIQL